MRSHRLLDTVIRVSDGVVWVVAGENETVLLPGDGAVTPAGESYCRWNEGDEEARYAEVFRPARTATPSLVHELRLASATAI
jgi:uncharacterized cupin superfamily protein